MLLRDGELVAALEAERFERIKHWAGFPTTTIQRLLDIAGIDGDAITAVAVSRQPRAHLLRKAAYAALHLSRHAVIDRIRNSTEVASMDAQLTEALRVPRRMLPSVHFVEHHRAHLASAFFVSPYERAAVASIDGMGDFVSTMTAHGDASRLHVLDQVYFPHSLGFLYTAVTQYLGFHAYGDEFKVMGLAPYGEPSFTNELRRLIDLRADGLFRLNLEYFRQGREGVVMEWAGGYPTFGALFTPALEKLLGPARRKDEPLTPRHEAIAASLQAVYEEAVFHVLRALHAKTRVPNLCLAGGCAMNSVANGKVRQQTPFDNVFVQPAAADNGTALGAAYHAWHVSMNKPRSFVMTHGYWGTAYDDESIGTMILSRENELDGVIVERFPDDEALCESTAARIADGNVVGWFQGRMEWGARALGNRSILADPRRSDMRDIINARIKHREKFRPFAPAILDESIDEYFEGAAPDPFMQSVYPIRAAKRVEIPAVTHADGTGRLQSVSVTTNPLFHRLIKAFYRITGIPVLLNTSFNENEPIVETPSQALDTFLRTRMDVIVIGRTMLRRPKSSPMIS